MDLGRILEQAQGDEVVMDIPGYQFTTKDMIIFILAIGKVMLIILLFIVCKSRQAKQGRLRMKWIE
ncbi:P6 protein [Raspberry vein chlorosis virus]|uniref:P6 protein n=1 Tax=Raspberry vein chlorosis virus TaxID=758677 RepID=A0A482P9Z3_9RHAB|nr:P6 protein [Raspberry vein chlorosis virus]QBS46635.1 P6 protein [Raspberry vein chlorosis virus]